MKAVIVTTITTTIDIETMTPKHEVDVFTDDELPQNIVVLAAIGACKSGALSLENREPT